jgi:uncharacterized protein YkwD
MLLALLMLAAPRASADATPGAPPKGVADAVQRAYERAKLPAPRADASLSRAAAALARIAVESGASAASEGQAIARALADAGAIEAATRILVLAAESADRAVEGLTLRPDLASGAATHYGFGSAAAPARGGAVLLFTERHAEIDAFPNRVEVGSTHRLAGHLISPLHDPRLYVTLPDGHAITLASELSSPDRFAAPIGFTSQGRYALEVIGQGPRGPEVAAILQVTAGQPSLTAPNGPSATLFPDTAAGVIEAINARRSAYGLSRLVVDPVLNKVSAAHSDDMARRNYFGHVSPDRIDLRGRLDSAKYAYQVALENIGEAKSPLAAHGAIEQSPGHLANILDPEVTRVGVGVVKVTRNGTDSALVTEVFALPTRERSSDRGADVLEVINNERVRRGLPAVAELPSLDTLALERVGALVGAGDPDAKVGGDLADRALEALPRAVSAAVDVFVADTAADAVASTNLGKKAFNKVGIGVARGTAKRFGRDRLWIVVIYAAMP